MVWEKSLREFLEKKNQHWYKRWVIFFLQRNKNGTKAIQIP